MIGIIGATIREVKDLTERLENKSEQTVSGTIYYFGELFGKKVVVCKCGAGKVFSAISAQTMIIKFGVEKIINVGASGSLNHDVKVGDFVIATKVVHHDFDTTGFGDEKGTIVELGRRFFETDKNIVDKISFVAKKSGIIFHLGTIASGDQFICDEKVKSEIVKEFGAISCEMEGASIGQVCTANEIPFCVLRYVTDNAEDGAIISYETLLPELAKKSVNLILEYVKNS